MTDDLDALDAAAAKALDLDALERMGRELPVPECGARSVRWSPADGICLSPDMLSALVARCRAAEAVVALVDGTDRHPRRGEFGNCEICTALARWRGVRG